MRTLLFAAFLLVAIPTHAQLVKETGQRVSLTDGNELYSWCTVGDNALIVGTENIKTRPEASTESIMAATKCWTYIEGVVDSTPAGGEFDPAPSVRLSQYVDVVIAFLKDHPNIRDQMAASLVTVALKEAFPHRKQ